MKKKTAPAKAGTRSVELPATPSARVSRESLQLIHVRIAARAHELYVQRGCLDGDHLHDWLKAEQEILGQAQDSYRTSAPM
jgi:hypothetical protein